MKKILVTLVICAMVSMVSAQTEPVLTLRKPTQSPVNICSGSLRWTIDFRNLPCPDAKLLPEHEKAMKEFLELLGKEGVTIEDTRYGALTEPDGSCAWAMFCTRDSSKASVKKAFKKVKKREGP